MPQLLLRHFCLVIIQSANSALAVLIPKNNIYQQLAPKQTYVPKAI